MKLEQETEGIKCSLTDLNEPGCRLIRDRFESTHKGVVRSPSSPVPAMT